MKRTAIWFLLNGLFAYLLYVGFYEGIEGAQNVFRFAVGLNFVLSLFLLDPEILKRIQAKGPSVPKWVWIPYAASMLTTMVWIGLTFSAIAYCFSVLMLYGAIYPDKEEQRS